MIKETKRRRRRKKKTKKRRENRRNGRKANYAETYYVCISEMLERGGTTRREGFLKIERNPFNASIFDASTLKQAGLLSSPEFSVFCIPVSIPPTSLKSNPTTVHNTHIYIPIHTTIERTC